MSNVDLDKETLFTQTRLRQGALEQNIPGNSEQPAISYWSKCLNIIKDNVNHQVFKTWFEPIQALKYEDNMLTIKVPSQFFCEWIEEHFYPLLQKTIFQVLGEHAKLQYRVVVDEQSEILNNRAIKVPAFKYPPGANQVQLPFADKPNLPEAFPSFLNPRYTFDNFIQGESNQLAGSAAMAVCKNPGTTRFNPLVIYGETGLGKTHLVHALGNCVARRKKNARVLYTTSERFTMEYVNALQNNKINEFINFYRSIDVLIVDDIQFFGGKEKTQDNFFHTFNALHQAGKQIILTSDKPPKDLTDVDDRLISRFQWGLIADIQSPDFEMRMAILQKKSEDEGIDLPPEIVEYIARHVKSHVRDLEGTLISLIARVTFDNRILNLDLAKEVVFGVANQEPKQLTVEDIKGIVSKYYKIPEEMLVSKSRKHEIALARQMAMYLTKQFTQLSLKSCGSHFGNRDHSTVLHSCQMIENYLVTDRNVKISYESLVNKVKHE